ncbi:MAG TPA: TonB-dependent receptor [Cytophagales bacterium]|nr:TonB-dependent receptor [Cytophagales bacterium]
MWAAFQLYAQEDTAKHTSFQVELLSSHREPLIGVLVWLDHRESVLESNLEGQVSFVGVAKGKHLLHVQAEGYSSIDTMVDIDHQRGMLSLMMFEDREVHKLDAVVIQQKSEVDRIRETGFNVNSIDLKPLHNLNLDINKVLNQTSGIRVREEGGLGSDFNFSLNGFANNQVKFFLDGMPMDHYGSSLSLNNIPVNLITRVDVYKGVVPIFLGSDALGGAVNVVTNESFKNYLDVSYSLGSFNTHRASAIGRYVHGKTGFTVNAKGIFNYSDNNYWIDIQVAKDGGSLKEYERIRKFHDAYRSHTLELEAGLTQKKYADRLLFGIITSGNHKEVQTGYNINKVAGAVYTTDQVLIPTFKYSKHDLFIKGLHGHVFANYNIREALNADTGKYLYSWYGRGEVNLFPRSGELAWDKTLFRFNDRSATAVSHLKYEFNKSHTVSINHTYNHYRRVGHDPLNYDYAPFKYPNTLSKNIMGLAYDASVLDHKLKTSLFVKAFSMNAETYKESKDEYGTEERIQKDYFFGGYGMALSYAIRSWIRLKTSYENTTRLPEASEMFGNGLLIENNPELRPERSQNFNVGLATVHQFKKNKVSLELSYLYRLPKDLIRTSVLGVTSKYENLVSAKVSCIEGGVKYEYNQLFFADVNVTYQDLINMEEYTPGGAVSEIYLDRLPNIPFLFGNASMGVQFKNVIYKRTKASIHWNTNFIEAFYLKWPSQGHEKLDIPRQISHSISIAYALQDDRYNVSLGCTNIANAQLFDNYKLQKPGRALSVKLRYFISK